MGKAICINDTHDADRLPPCATPWALGGHGVCVGWGGAWGTRGGGGGDSTPDRPRVHRAGYCACGRTSDPPLPPKLLHARVVGMKHACICSRGGAGRDSQHAHGINPGSRRAADPDRHPARTHAPTCQCTAPSPEPEPAEHLSYAPTQVDDIGKQGALPCRVAAAPNAGAY